MQLTQHTDYSLRALLYLSQQPNKTTTINEVAQFYQISKNHLVKVVHQLVQHGFVTSTRGKGGGICLARDAHDIRLGEVIKTMEPHLNLVECFNKQTSQCRISTNCMIKSALNQALNAFFNELNQYTLADICKRKSLQKDVIHFLNQQQS